MHSHQSIGFKTNNDSSVQAMTEVALGLSMAFFAILIVALISMGVPQERHSSLEQLDIDESTKLLLADNQAHKNNKQVADSNNTEELSYLFYYQGKFYDQGLNVTNLNTLQNDGRYVLAFSANTKLQETLQVKRQFEGLHVMVTQMSEDWQNALEIATKRQ